MLKPELAVGIPQSAAYLLGCLGIYESIDTDIDIYAYGITDSRGCRYQSLKSRWSAETDQQATVPTQRRRKQPAGNSTHSTMPQTGMSP